MTIRKGARVVIRRSSFLHPKSSIEHFVASHPFNSALQIYLPRTNETSHIHQERQDVGAEAGVESVDPPDDLSASPSRAKENSQVSVADQPYSSCPYSLIRCNLAALLEADFLERHIRGSCAQFSALSVNTPTDRTDVAGIVPDGHLILSVTKHTYERLGLVGQHVSHDPGTFLCT